MKLSNFVLAVAGSFALVACVSAGSVPMVGANTASASLASANCAQVGKLANTNANRSDGVAQNSEGLRAHPVKLCKGTAEVGTAIFWSGTNAEGTRLTTKPTDLAGSEYQITDGGFDPSIQTNTVVFEVPTNGDPMLCTITKPSGGISPFKVASCV